MASENKKSIADYLLGLWGDYDASYQWMLRRWYMDACDASILGYDANKLRGASADLSKELDGMPINPFNRDSIEGTINDWRNNVNFNIKVKPKAIAMFSQYLQIYAQNGQKFPARLDPTPSMDIEEIISQNKDLLLQDMVKDLLINANQNGQAVDLEAAAPQLEAMAQQMLEQMQIELERREKEGFKKAQLLLDDAITDGNTEKFVVQMAWDNITFGVCVGRTPVVKTSKRRVYRKVPATINGGFDFVKEPAYEIKYTINGERIKPWRFRMDPDAEGDVQYGRGVFEESFASTSDLNQMLSLPGYDVETITELLKSTNSSGENGFRESRTPQDSTKASHGKTFRVLEFFGQLTVKQLEKANMQRIIMDAFSTDHYDQAVFDDESQTVIVVKPSGANFPIEVHAVLVDDKLVYLSENKYPDNKRPYVYNRMIPEPDSNMGHSIYALGRPIVELMSRFYQRAADNEELTGNASFAVMESMVEPFDSFEPGQIIKVSEDALMRGMKINDVVQQMKFNGTSQGLMNMFYGLDPILDEVTMVSKQMQGMSERGEQTAFEVSQKINQSQSMTMATFRDFDQNIVKGHVESIFNFIQNDVNTPEDAKIDGVVRSYGAETFAVMSANKQKLTEMLSITAQMPPEYIQQVNVPGIYRLLIDSIGLDEKDVLLDPKQVDAVNMLTQQVEQMAQQVQALQQQLEQAWKAIQEKDKQANELQMQNFQLKELAKKEFQVSDLQRELMFEKTKGKLSSKIDAIRANGQRQNRQENQDE